MHDKILILDFGSQVTQLIARRVREAHVFSEVHPCDVSDAWIRDYAKDGSLKGVILSGSHASVYEDTTDKAPQAVFELGVPVLGICYGMQTMAHQLGGKVESGHQGEFGFAAVRARGFLLYPGKLTQTETFRVGCIGAIGPHDMRQAVHAIGLALQG